MKNIVIILSGGTGTRLGGNVPKQYIQVNGKTILSYSMQPFIEMNEIDGIVIVCHSDWIDFIKKENNTKILGFAMPGKSRQESILNGLKKIHELKMECDNVIIHDGARPNVSTKIIRECLDNLNDYDGVMPSLPCKDTLYYCKNGKIEKLLERDKIFAGQSPEAFKFEKYFNINSSLSSSELEKIKGSSEIAFKNGLNIKIINGQENNYKITTINDLEKFKSEKGLLL